MSEEAETADEQLPLEGVGQRLARAREAAGLSVDDLAKHTRIPIRHLEVIETGDFAALPARTYAIGFSRTYARAVGLDEREIADEVRSELGDSPVSEAHRAGAFEPGDPARVPSRRLAWFSAFAVVLLIAGGLAFFRGYFFPGSGPGSIIAPAETAQNTAAENSDPADPRPSIAVAKPTGQVVFTALEDNVWVKIYDSAGERLMEKQMAKGERYSVPATAQGPQIWTGQPEALAISVGGKAIGNLSEESEIVRDISITAEALVERVAANTAAAASAEQPATQPTAEPAT